MLACVSQASREAVLEHLGNFYNQTMHALMDVGAGHGGCEYRLRSMAEEMWELIAAAKEAKQ